MDRLFDENWQPKKPLPVAYPSFFNSRRAVSSDYKAEVKKLEAKGTDFKAETKTYAVGQKSDPRPTPQRRGWAKRNRQVQRYWHAENVGLLPFTSKPLAASVGCTVAEMNAMPINPRACDVVFDALSRSQSGITEEEFCDERRAAWQAADGSFDAAAFEADGTGRRTIASAYFLSLGSRSSRQPRVVLAQGQRPAAHQGLYRATVDDRRTRTCGRRCSASDQPTVWRRQSSSREL